MECLSWKFEAYVLCKLLGRSWIAWREHRRGCNISSSKSLNFQICFLVENPSKLQTFQFHISKSRVQSFHGMNMFKLFTLWTSETLFTEIWILGRGVETWKLSFPRKWWIHAVTKQRAECSSYWKKILKQCSRLFSRHFLFKPPWNPEEPLSHVQVPTKTPNGCSGGIETWLFFELYLLFRVSKEVAPRKVFAGGLCPQNAPLG